jgi:hypothetical protein
MLTYADVCWQTSAINEIELSYSEALKSMQVPTHADVLLTCC